MYTHSRPPPTPFWTPHDNKSYKFNKTRSLQNDSSASSVQSTYLNETEPLSASMLHQMEKAEDQRMSHAAWVSGKVSQQTRNQHSYYFDLDDDDNNNNNNNHHEMDHYFVDPPPVPPAKTPIQLASAVSSAQNHKHKHMPKNTQHQHQHQHQHMDQTINHLRSLQQSCVQSMSNLRVVRAEFLHEGNEGDLRSAQLTPLQQTVNVQAARIVDLEQKLAKAEEIYDLVQAQQRYIVEMESTLATMEGDLNAKQREESNYKESYNDIIRNNTELKMAKEGLVSDCDRLSCEKAELLEQIKGLQGRAVAKMIIDWNRTLLTKVFENWRKDATETANYKRVVLKFKAKMMNACIWRCYRSWVNLVAENGREKKVLNKFRARMLNLTVTRSFNSWCGFVADRLRLKKLGLKIFNKVVLGELYSGWSQFCSQILLAKDAADEFLQHQKKQERDQLVLLKFCNRMVRKTLCDCFDSIKNNWVVRKKTRRLLNRYFGPMESDFVKCAWRIWRDNCRDLR